MASAITAAVRRPTRTTGSIPRDTRRVLLLAETVERVRTYWRGWETGRARQDTVSVVVLGEDHFARTPDRLRSRLTRAPVDSLDALVVTLGDEVEQVVADARLCYADATTARLDGAARAVEVPDDDPRFLAMAARADESEWREASADEPCDLRFGILEHDELASVASVRTWDATLGHVGVYTDTEARRRGLARTVAAAAVRHALHVGLVPQWRVRVENEGSLRVADALGFVPCGRQFLVRVRPSPELIPD